MALNPSSGAGSCRGQMRLREGALGRDTAWVRRVIGWGWRWSCTVQAAAWLLACADVLPERSLPVGRVSGFVRLAEGAALPAFPEPLLATEPLRPRAAIGPTPAECEQANRESLVPVRLAKSRGLSAMLVTASDFRRARKREPRSHRVVIEGCALRPQTVAITFGDHLALENRDAFAFAPLHGPAYEVRPLRQGQRVLLPTFPASIEPITCSRDAPCGRADVIVLRHAVHAVTDALGAFVIDDFPAAELVRLTTFHPLFEEAETSVWVDPGQHVRVELHVRPKPRFVP